MPVVTTMGHLRLWAPAWTIVLILVGIQQACSAARLRGQGFVDVAVHVNQDIPMEKADLYLNNLKSLLRNASMELYRATRNRMYLAEVKIHIPNSWKVQETTVIEALPRDDFDIVIKNEHLIFPRKQEGQRTDSEDEPPVERFVPVIYTTHGPKCIAAGITCGRRGSHVNIPVTYLEFMDDNLFQRALGKPGKLLSVEMAKFFWGIYDEHGYLADLSYPFLIRDPSNMRKTITNGCYVLGTNNDDNHLNMVTGQKCEKSADGDAEEGKPYCLNPLKCMFVPVSSWSNSETSLLHQPFWDTVTSFCNDSTHNSYVITKQNIYCARRSVWSVFNSTPDFIEMGSFRDDLTEDDLMPVITVYRPTTQNVIFAIDVSSSMNNTRLDVIRSHLNNTLRKFRAQDGVNIGLVTFSRGATRAFDLRPMMQPGVIEDLVASIPLEGNGSTCIDCALAVILPTIVEGDNKTNVIFITDGYANELMHRVSLRPPNRPLAMFNRANAASIRIHGIFYGRNPVVYPPLAILMQMTGTEPHYLPVGLQSDDSIGLHLESALGTFIWKKGAREKFAEKHFSAKLSFSGTRKSQRIPLPKELAEKSSVFIYTYKKADRFRIISAFLRIGKRQSLKATSITHLHQSQRVEIKFDLPLLPMHLLDGLGTSLEIHGKGISTGSLTHALLTSSAADADMKVSAWFGSQPTLISDADLPLDIYARVVNSTWRPLGIIPTVTVKITGPRGVTQYLKLQDNGLDPDFEAGDSIYAGYLVSVPEPGSYYANVLVHHPYHLQPKIVPAGKFQFTEAAGWVIGTGEKPDTISPSRITDLQVNVEHDGQLTGLQWTAPGDDANQGKATEYVMQYFVNLMSLSRAMDLSTNGSLTENKITKEHLQTSATFEPLKAGEPEFYDFSSSALVENLTNKYHTVYFIVRAVDEAGNAGQTSNVGIWMPQGRNDSCYLPDPHHIFPSDKESLEMW